MFHEFGYSIYLSPNVSGNWLEYKEQGKDIKLYQIDYRYRFLARVYYLDKRKGFWLVEISRW